MHECIPQIRQEKYFRLHLSRERELLNLLAPNKVCSHFEIVCSNFPKPVGGKLWKISIIFLFLLFSLFLFVLEMILEMIVPKLFTVINSL